MSGHNGREKYLTTNRENEVKDLKIRGSLTMSYDTIQHINTTGVTLGFDNIQYPTVFHGSASGAYSFPGTYTVEMLLNDFRKITPMEAYTTFLQKVRNNTTHTITYNLPNGCTTHSGATFVEIPTHQEYIMQYQLKTSPLSFEVTPAQLTLANGTAIFQPLAAILTDFAVLTGGGIVCRDLTGSHHYRSVTTTTPGSIAITNPDGIAGDIVVDYVGAPGGVSSFEGRTGAVVSANGDYTASEITNVPSGTIAATNVQTAINELNNEKQPINTALTNLAALPGNGYVVQTGADTFVNRTITTATPASVTITNGDGVAANTQINFTGVSSFEGRTGNVVSANGDYTASEVTNVPAGTIAATNVQTALNELDTEKVPYQIGLPENQIMITNAAGTLEPLVLTDDTATGGMKSTSLVKTTDVKLHSTVIRTGYSAISLWHELVVPFLDSQVLSLDVRVELSGWSGTPYTIYQMSFDVGRLFGAFPFDYNYELIDGGALLSTNVRLYHDSATHIVRLYYLSSAFCAANVYVTPGGGTAGSLQPLNIDCGAGPDPDNLGGGDVLVFDASTAARNGDKVPSQIGLPENQILITDNTGQLEPLVLTGDDLSTTVVKTTDVELRSHTAWINVPNVGGPPWYQITEAFSIDGGTPYLMMEVCNGAGQSVPFGNYPTFAHIIIELNKIRNSDPPYYIYRLVQGTWNGTQLRVYFNAATEEFKVFARSTAFNGLRIALSPATRIPTALIDCGTGVNPTGITGYTLAWDLTYAQNENRFDRLFITNPSSTGAAAQPVYWTNAGGATQYELTVGVPSALEFKNILPDVDFHTEKLYNIIMKTYAWKADESQKPYLGIIADEIAADDDLKYLVTYDWKNPERIVGYNNDYLVMFMLKELQRLKTENNTLLSHLQYLYSHLGLAYPPVIE